VWGPAHESLQPRGGKARAIAVQFRATRASAQPSAPNRPLELDLRAFDLLAQRTSHSREAAEVRLAQPAGGGVWKGEGRERLGRVTAGLVNR
jgi:hypothetical protein